MNNNQQDNSYMMGNGHALNPINQTPLPYRDVLPPLLNLNQVTNIRVRVVMPKNTENILVLINGLSTINQLKIEIEDKLSKYLLSQQRLSENERVFVSKLVKDNFLLFDDYKVSDMLFNDCIVNADFVIRKQDKAEVNGVMEDNLLKKRESIDKPNKEVKKTKPRAKRTKKKAEPKEETVVVEEVVKNDNMEIEVEAPRKQSSRKPSIKKVSEELPKPEETVEKVEVKEAEKIIFDKKKISIEIKDITEEKLKQKKEKKEVKPKKEKKEVKPKKEKKEAKPKKEKKEVKPKKEKKEVKPKKEKKEVKPKKEAKTEEKDEFDELLEEKLNKVEINKNNNSDNEDLLNVLNKSQSEEEDDLSDEDGSSDGDSFDAELKKKQANLFR